MVLVNKIYKIFLFFFSSDQFNLKNTKFGTANVVDFKGQFEIKLVYAMGNYCGVTVGFFGDWGTGDEAVNFVVLSYAVVVDVYMEKGVGDLVLKILITKTNRF